MRKSNYNYKYKSLTSKAIEEELKRETYKSKYIKVLKSTFYALITIAAVAAIIATLLMPVLQINGSSMSPNLNEGEIVIAFKTSNIKKGDIIAFYHGNKILVKRVIATQGDWVNIDKDGNVYIDGNLLEEPYINNKELGESNITFPIQVPDGQYFVLGDHRDTSLDSRNEEIGCIKKEDILGKVIVRVWPINKINTL